MCGSPFLARVRAWRDEAELDLGHPQQRAVLAALLVREGAQVTVEELIDGCISDRFRSVHGQATVDVEDLPGDEIRVRRGQEEDRSRKILGQLIALDRHAINAIAEAHKPDSAAHLKPGHPAGAARPWPSVEKPTVRTDRPNGTDACPLCVRGQRNMTVYSATW